LFCKQNFIYKKLRDTTVFLSRISFFYRIIKWLIIALVFVFLSESEIQASSKPEVLKEAEQLGLADDPTWLKLLHYDRDNKKSTVLTDSFFLSPDGRTCPSSELTATINAYFAPEGDDCDKHARCRFPARYYWLSHKLSSFDYRLGETKCQRLEKWGLFNSVKSVSILLVSGYFGNPASTFGHALLKLNADSANDESGLFDSTLNYGALIPEHENVLRYVARGIFGGYKAGFSDKYFYTQDLVYSRAEFRDIWDYRLVLSDYERTLLLLHIWEIVGNKFDYFFLDKNCAYKLAELVNLVIEEDLLDNGHFWYIPVELFHRLNDIDKARKESSGKNLIQSAHFIPSSQRKLYHQLRLLKPDEFEVFNAIVREGIDSLPKHLSKLEIEKQIFVLDSLLAYQQYRLVAKNPEANRDRVKFKDQILLARLRLPPHQVANIKIPELPSPAEGSRPMVFGVSVVSEDNEEKFLRLTWSPFKQETVGQNSLEGDELVVFDLAVGLFEDRNKAFVNKFDLLRILNLNTLSVKAMDESQWSWKLRVGMDRVEEDEEDHYDGVFSFGAGQAWKWNETVISYGIVDLAGHTIAPYVRVRPHLGMRYDFGDFKALLFGGVESASYDGRFRDVWGGKVQYQLTDRCAVYTEFSNENATLVSLGLSWYL